MSKRILIGLIGGISYTLFTWEVALLGVIQWIGKNNLKEMAINDVAAPFSLLVFFLFLSFYLFYKWQPLEKKNKSFFNLFSIGFSFSIGATATIYPLLLLDGISSIAINPLVIAFFVIGNFVALLVTSFYLFIKPPSISPPQEVLDKVFSKL